MSRTRRFGPITAPGKGTSCVPLQAKSSSLAARARTSSICTPLGEAAPGAGVASLYVAAIAIGFARASVINIPGTDSFSLNSETGLIFISSDGSKVTTAATVPQHFLVQGTGTTTAPVGEGPGGQVAVNVLTHQALVADEFGHDLRLVQMPTAPITGPATATNAFTIAATVLPKPLASGTAMQLGMRGDPNSVTMDLARNYAYVLADALASCHGFNVNYPLFLIRVDLSGATKGVAWTPSMQAIRMP